MSLYVKLYLIPVKPMIIYGNETFGYERSAPKEDGNSRTEKVKVLSRVYMVRQ
jgi:hypothetical protein